ncbi:MAG: hypothetical protein ACTSSH_14270 [Candidatus Heimdallarchaeota archaeon]
MYHSVYNCFWRAKKITELASERKYAPCCTWQEDADCDNCSSKTELDCKWNRKHLLRFLFALTPMFVVMIGTLVVEVIFTGIWWPILVDVGYFALFFIIETRILCSHCPYYSKDGLILHCLANHGFIKFARYHPEPMSPFERGLLRVGFVLFALVPIGVQIPSIIYAAAPSTRTIFIVLLVLLGTFVITLSIAFTILFTLICTRCVNFSCPFNRVPDDLVDTYLTKSPDMKQAWIDSGYQPSEK